MLHESKTVMGIGFDQKIASPFILRLDLANCMFGHTEPEPTDWWALLCLLDSLLVNHFEQIYWLVEPCTGIDKIIIKKMTQYHHLPTNTAQHSPRTTEYQPVLLEEEPVPPYPPYSEVPNGITL